MADGTTPNLSLILPEVGQSADTWGSKTNANWSSVDSAINDRLLLTGGNLTGNLVMNNDIRIAWKDADSTVRDHIGVGPGNNLNFFGGYEGIRFWDQPHAYELAKFDNYGCFAFYGRTPGNEPVIQSLYATAYASNPRTVQAPTGDGNLIFQNSGTINRGKLQWMNTDGKVYDRIYVGGSNWLNFVSGSTAAGFRFNNVGEATTVAWIDNAGNMTVRTLTQFSDYRLKNIHGGTRDAGRTLDAIPVFDAAWKETPDDVHPMLIAHELEAVCPWAVTGAKDGVDEAGRIAPQGVDYAALVPLLIAEVQALRRRVATLEHATPR